VGDAETVISVQNLSKKYVIRHEADTQPTSLREVMAGGTKAFARRLFGRSGDAVAAPTREEFWALRDLSFEVQRGSVVGVIGRNGAGKSTLLKILSRITEPTSGRVEITGRVSSLLEVGTGFHPELTGRENIFLNGAILGMSRQEIRHKFDEIVSFSEIEKFLDTPVKRYSSGMYVRLAFAVAAHLEPEILIVDEVLAVGDAPFQRKCLGKIRDVAGRGRTVLFVSHNSTAMQALCSEAIWIQTGGIEKKGPVEEVLHAYLQSVIDLSITPLGDRTDRQGSGEVRFTSIALESPDGCPATLVMSGAPCTVRIDYEGSRPLRDPIVRMTIYSRLGQPIFHLNTTYHPVKVVELPARGTVRCRIERLPLTAGAYRVDASLFDETGKLDHIPSIMAFEVGPGNYYRTTHPPFCITGAGLIEHGWEFDQAADSTSG
jgi:homopolymeric O-antigen transport system ATP-binding protein